MSSANQHIIDYIILTVILVVSALSVLIFSFDPVSIRIITFFLAAGYAIWGITHHRKAGHIDRKIVLEYAGISALSLVIIYSLIR